MFKTLAISAALLAIVGATALVSVAGIVAMTADDAPTPALGAQHASAPLGLTAAETSLLVSLNHWRNEHGRPSLVIDWRLEAAARERAPKIRSGPFWDPHLLGGEHHWQTAQHHGYPRNHMTSENIAWGQADAHEAVYGSWAHSVEGHREAMLGNWTCVGIGCVGTKYGTIFGR